MNNGRNNGSQRKSSVRAKKASAPRHRVIELEQVPNSIRRGETETKAMDLPLGERLLAGDPADDPYRMLVQTMSEGVASLDAKGTIIFANRRFAEFVEQPLERFIGSRLQDYVSPAALPRLEALLESGTRGSVKGEVELRRDGGRKVLVRLSLSPLKSSDGIVCAVATDLTGISDNSEALKASEIALRLLSTRLLEIQDEERRRIARDLHDVTGQKLALQCIALSRMTRLVSPTANDETRESIAQCLDLTNQIVEDIRTLSYLMHPPLLDELGLPAAVKWYAQGFQKRTGIHMDVDVAPGVPRLRPDAELTLFRVVQESLTNVHRYSGSASAYIRITADEDEYKVEVGDFGKGMKVDQTTEVAPLGVGIQGMRQRIRQLAGALDIFSKLGKGTIVIAALPILKLALPAEKEPIADSADGDLSTSNSKSETVHRILIADDHEMLRRGLRSMLEKESDFHICGEAKDGVEAVEKALELKPDLVIIDINMPALNGLTVVRQILRSSPETLILVFTVHDSEQTLQESLNAGAHGFVSKARAGRDLIDAVRAVLAGKQFYPSLKLESAAAHR
jgi:PAS domain S-box-containing protein